MADRILVPMDGSEQSEAALAYAIENNPDAEITVLNAYGLEQTGFAHELAIVHRDEVLETAKEHAEQVFDRARELAAELDYEGDLSTIAEEGDPKQVIPEHAADFDAVFIGTHGREGTSRILLGSVAETVVRRAPVPVTVVK